MKQIKICEDIIFKKLKNRILLYNISTTEIFVLDNISADFWKTIAKEKNISLTKSIVKMIKKYPKFKNELAKDIPQLVNDLMKIGVLE